MVECVLDFSFGLCGGSLGERFIEVVLLEEDFGLRNLLGRWCCVFVCDKYWDLIYMWMGLCIISSNDLFGKLGKMVF